LIGGGGISVANTLTNIGKRELRNKARASPEAPTSSQALDLLS
jgi:hypothetical protein